MSTKRDYSQRPIENWQKKKIHTLATGKKNLTWSHEEYKNWLDQAFGVTTCLHLDYYRAYDVINALEELCRSAQPKYLAGKTPAVRIEAWNSELFTANAIRGIVDTSKGKPPLTNQVKHVSGMLWDMCNQDDIESPAAYACAFIKGIIGQPKIETRRQAQQVAAALRKRGGKQGCPTGKKTRGGGPK